VTTSGDVIAAIIAERRGGAEMAAEALQDGVEAARDDKNKLIGGE